MNGVFVDGAVGLAFGHRDETVVVALAVVSGIDDDVASPFGESVDHLVDQELQSVECGTLLPDDAARVLPRHVELDSLGVGADVDLHIEVHQVDELLENLRGLLGFAVPSELRRVFLG